MKLVIIGNGVAGTTTARLVADRDSSVDITVYSQERYAYYPRPRLIDYLAGDVSLDEMSLYDAAWYAARGIEVRLDQTVVSLSPQEHRLTLDDGQTVTYDKLVLACGAHGWMPPIEGRDRPGVFTLRTLDDAQAIRSHAQSCRHITILGGGLLGLDTAAALCGHVAEITVVEMFPRLLPRQLDQQGADMLATMVGKMGIEVITDDVCSAIQGELDVSRVQLKSGKVLDTDMVIISAGVRANIALAQAAGLACNRGVIVNEKLQTSQNDIYAVGDVAEYADRVWGIIPAALSQARVAAQQILGGDALYEDIVPSTTLQVSGIDLTSLGEVNPDDGNCNALRYEDHERGIYKKTGHP